MRTMYITMNGNANFYGTATNFAINKMFATKEDAIANGIKNVTENKAETFTVIEKTIDETTFTVIENEVYDYYKEVQAKENAKKRITEIEKIIAEIEKTKANCKTERGIARKDKEITEYKAIIDNLNKVINK